MISIRDRHDIESLNLPITRKVDGKILEAIQEIAKERNCSMNSLSLTFEELKRGIGNKRQIQDTVKRGFIDSRLVREQTLYSITIRGIKALYHKKY